HSYLYFLHPFSRAFSLSAPTHQNSIPEILRRPPDVIGNVNLNCIVNLYCIIYRPSRQDVSKVFNFPAFLQIGAFLQISALKESRNLGFKTEFKNFLTSFII
uniref:Uncharacterized protein n=1 Tax=Callorhinchus milii TaxID=7868 RepID=A0A4W3JMM0_CALMI